MLLFTMILQASAAAVLGKVGVAFAAALAAFAGAFGISKIGKTTMEAISRQPESAGNMRSTLIIAAGMIEGASLFAIIVCLMALIL